jgi:hypothetical protein
MSLEEKSQALFTKFNDIFVESKLYDVDHTTNPDYVAKRAARFKKEVTHHLLKEFSVNNSSNANGHDYEGLFRLFSVEEMEQFNEKLDRAVAQLVLETKEGKADQIFSEEQKNISLVTRFLLGIATFGIYEICYRVTRNKQAKTKFANLIEFCKNTQESLKTEYMAAVGSFPRPKEYSVFYKMFGGRSKADDFDYKLAAHKGNVELQMKEDKAARVIQAAFRKGVSNAEARLEVLSEIDAKSLRLQKQKQQTKERKLSLHDAAEVVKTDLEGVKRDKKHHNANKEELTRELLELGELWQQHKDKEKLLEQEIHALDIDINKLRNSVTADAPRTWGVLNRAGAKVSEQERVKSLESQIADKKHKMEVAVADLAATVQVLDGAEEKIYRTRVALDIELEAQGAVLNKKEKDLLDRYSHIKKGEKKAEHNEGVFVERQQALSGYRRIIEERQKNAEKGKKTYIDTIEESRKKYAALKRQK